MNGAKLGAIATTALTAMYVLLMGNTAFALITSSDLIAQAIGVLMMVFPGLAIWLVVSELRFGARLEKLSNQLLAEEAWPKFNFDVRPSGRVVRTSADAEFEKYRQKVDEDPANWRNWFALGLVYDAAGDRRRARASMRKAIELANDPQTL
jgi:tetratricopeptide (TPR) repeat protein